ncbi:sigma-70 family RNA polymerase sigma factor [Segetibacter sp. 3557_3]|uniref:sigma-70 family RNA polymerase sigma factor n=1 Tax=Segetibacter sp. 3557_3 TaxID=2547429 RepID=UPI001058C805|nr:sigma-70 family RNA polymerase sigma factor [Segetibacter sp. 3557_3]TDH26376.1 sigma-70 family RNA polymerase sigma factor [Segetibacter sp. 3557_3]
MEDKVREIWERFDKQLKGYICTKMNNNNECLDVLQDVYLKIIKNIDRISAVEDMPSYLNRLASNAVADHYRQISRKPVLSSGDVNNLVIIDEVREEEEVVKNCCLQCLEPGIDTLPEKYKAAFMLSEIEGIPQREVAEKLGITLSGAKSRVQRAREKLREEVLKCCSKQSPENDARLT